MKSGLGIYRGISSGAVSEIETTGETSGSPRMSIANVISISISQGIVFSRCWGAHSCYSKPLMEFSAYHFCQEPFPIRDDGTSARKTGSERIVTMILCGAHAVETPQIMDPTVLYLRCTRATRCGQGTQFRRRKKSRCEITGKRASSSYLVDPATGGQSPSSGRPRSLTARIALET